ncbi:MAG: DUF4434 domain-containing protein [Firmicutes bacterium]|nr:DUF4434 domain-containing protein [Bacillota bacterium]
MAYKAITGTFLDEITYDIPSSNWGEEEWTTEFGTMKRAGIDTVIVIRAGLGEKLACPARTISKHVPTLPVYQDLIALFLKLAAQNGMRLFLGLYDSNRFWYRNDWQTEVGINKEFIREMLDRYGSSPAFAGWYLPHETPDTSFRIIEIQTSLAEEIRKLSGLPILISPYFFGRLDPMLVVALQEKAFPRSVEEHVRQWSEIFSRLEGLVNYCAFQDGTVEFLKLEEFVRATAEIARKHQIELWSNLETFDRDTPIKFPPIDWRKLAYKLEAVQPHVSKVITFEFSHFLSPHSIWPSAHALYRRYEEFLRARGAYFSQD